MSWLFSRALVEEYSAATCSAGEPLPPLSVMPTPHKFWHADKTMEPSDLSRFGQTCAPLTESRGAELLTLFQAGFHAKTSASPAAVTAWPELEAGSGRTWRGSFAKYNQQARLWKTAQCSLLEDSEQFSETWPRWGSMRNGESFLRPMFARPTSANESGLWPTPVADDTGSRSKPYAQGGTPLSLAVKLWPTPTVKGNYNRKGASATSGDGLATAVRMWPTPTAMTRSGGAALCKWGGSRSRAKLRTMVTSEELNGPLNPMWVEWLMGWPIGWTDLRPLATDKFQEWRQQHSPRSQQKLTDKAAA